MLIDRIYIKNFKSIRDSGDVFIKPLNILIGPNGVGKSNFISFFKLLNSISESKLPSYVAENGYADKILYFGKKKSKELAGGIIFRTIKNTNNRYDFVLKPDQANGFYFEIETGGYNRYSSGYNESWDYITLESQGEKNSGIKDHTADRFFYLGEYFRQFKIFHFHDTSSSAPLKQPSKVRDNSYLKEDGSNLPSFLYRIQQQQPSQFRLIEYAIRSIAPFFEQFDLKPDNLNQDTIFLTWKEKGSDDYFNANDLSDGTLRFIALTTLLLQAEPPKTIIIDEPELGLHPSAINKLAALIKAASFKSQIIASTQSVNLLDQFEANDIIVVDREDNQSTFKRLNSEQLQDWLSNYTIGELWEKNVIGGTP
ncbi:AAA family ATPase [Pontibacter ramchanderi]|uniref:Putative ATPase n=1 Tax=Pontibacter ramchanderi TaxID=1179743 RepID=A0A2N3V2U9_9BACT|nr:AAA family ATPase [Pontibacter ramchanderi]PKV75896.1 putative ATPase [Pontibacter ramchanderi]